MLNVRTKPKKELPEWVTITLSPAEGCMNNSEEAVDYEEFLKAR